MKLTRIARLARLATLALVTLAVVSLAITRALADNPHITLLSELLDVAVSQPAPADGDTLTFDAATGKWRNQASFKPQHIDLTGLLGSFPETTFFTAPSDGIYRVTAVGENIGDNQPAFTLTIGASHFAGDNSFSAGSQILGRTFSVQMKSGDTLTFATVVSSGSYDLHFVVEKL